MKKIIESLKSLFRYLSITDKAGKYVSLTNILMLVVIYKVMKTPVLSVQELVLLAGALTTYIHRRSIDSKKKEENDDLPK